MARTSLPPGFRFHPTDVELIMYYLKRKVMGKKFHFAAIAELNIYKFSPWDLADKSLLKTRDLEWYFFSPIEKKYGSGGRTNRATETGYWKTTGKDRSVAYNGRAVGMIKTLVFYKGHAPKGVRTDWVMHEYRIEDKNLADIGVIQDSFVVCKLFQKSGLGPKNGAQYGAPFSEEEWDEMDYVDSSHRDCSFLSVDYQPSSHNNGAAVSLVGATTSGCWPTSEPVPYPAQPLAMQCPMANPPSNDVFELSSICTEDRATPHILNNNNTENANVCLQALQKTGPSPKTGSKFSYHEVSDVEEICAHQCTNQNSSAVPSSIVPGTSFSSVVSAVGQSQAAPADMNDLLEEDITELLSMFTESSSVIPVENTNKHFETVINRSVDALTCTDKNALYDGLGDLDNLIVPTKSGFDFSNTWDTAYTPNQMLMGDDMIFLELNDLDAPLMHPAKTTDTLWGQTDYSYAPYTCYRNMDGSYCRGDQQNAAQNVFTLNRTSVLPDGPGWMEEVLEVPVKGTAIRRLECYGSDSSMGNEIGYSTSCRQPEESTITEQTQRRGEPQRHIRLQHMLECMYAQSGSPAELFARMITAEIFDGSSSMYFKAEVALKVGKCTDDALSHNMGESIFCWGKMPKSNLGVKVINWGPKFEPIIYHWEVSSIVGLIIIYYQSVCSLKAPQTLKIRPQLSKLCFYPYFNSITLNLLCLGTLFLRGCILFLLRLRVDVYN